MTFDEIAAKTEGFTSIDLVSLFKELRIKMIRRLVDGIKVGEDALDRSQLEKLELDRDNFEQLFAEFRPSLNKNDVRKIESDYKSFQTRGTDVAAQKTTLQ